MPPVLGPASPSPIRLKSWAGTRGTARRPVAEDEQRALLARQPLLDHDVAPGVAEGGARELGVDVGAGLVERLGHQHALAGGQAVGLDHPGPGQRLEVVQGGGGLERVEGGEARRRARRPRRGPPS